MAVDPYGRRQSSAGRQSRGVPQNPRLWEMLVAQAKQKFQTYPSIPASKWVHSEYVKRGGTFVESKKKDTRHDRRGKLTSEGKKEEARKKKEKG
jgi:hypothetical protein